MTALEPNVGSAGTEILDTDLWVYNRILTDQKLSDLGLNRNVFDGLAPLTTPFPFIVYQWQGGHDIGVITTARSSRLISVNTYVIKVMSEAAQLSVVKPFTDRIDELFSCPSDQRQYTLPDGTEWMVVYNSHRIEPFSMYEQDGGRVWRHKGGVYEINTQSFKLGELTGYGYGPYGSGPYGGQQ